MPQKVYTFSFIVGNMIPKSVKCLHSATKGFTGFRVLVTSGLKWRRKRWNKENIEEEKA